MQQSETYMITRGEIKFEVPRKCPHCLNTMTADIILESEHIEIEEVKHIALLAQCKICNRFYALDYAYRYNYTTEKHETLLIPYDYKPNIKVDIPEIIDSFSEDFREIYTQAKLAEAYNLHQIAGMGYRKATEYLVKDYLVFKKVDDEDKIQNTRLGNAIDRIDNDKIKILAKATTYLGNDETHPIRKHPDKDIQDLKMFLKALIHFVAFELSASDAADMIAEN